MESIPTDACSTLMGIRMTGQTTSCIATLLQNPNAKMVVALWSHADQLARQYPLSKDRFITVEQLSKLRGWNGVLVYDTPAVLALIQDGYRRGKEDAEKKSKPDVDISHKIDYGSAREFLPILKLIAKKLDAFIFVTKK